MSRAGLLAVALLAACAERALPGGSSPSVPDLATSSDLAGAACAGPFTGACTTPHLSCARDDVGTTCQCLAPELAWLCCASEGVGRCGPRLPDGSACCASDYGRYDPTFNDLRPCCQDGDLCRCTNNRLTCVPC